ncbi:hypothetical protein [Streptomyces sp. 11x1]|uniref:hypothetical protein n=1 Tax=Streptomyces sp. 11x1 TaxID=3038642 RepID=UPI00292F08CB|nr:hypothetical protein [Streptomyces sp. 11x1]WNZ07670.1 hypothetical protein P8T65_08820 [Streptomyces sp. 11x1]
MIAMAWTLIAVQLLVTGHSAFHLRRVRHRCVTKAYRSRSATSALVIVCVLPLVPLLATDAPAAAWGPWGVGCTAAALVHAFVDAFGDTPSGTPAATSRPPPPRTPGGPVLPTDHASPSPTPPDAAEAKPPLCCCRPSFRAPSKYGCPNPKGH